jgi:hypothetical protein
MVSLAKQFSCRIVSYMHDDTSQEESFEIFSPRHSHTFWTKTLELPKRILIVTLK